jgi:hypothetical protein
MCRWWNERKFPQPDAQFLPPTGLVVAYGTGKLICGGFLFKTDARMASLGNLVSDPQVRAEDRSEAVELLISKLMDVARENGYSMVSAATNLPRLMSRYEKLGFSRTDDNVSHFGRIFPCH